MSNLATDTSSAQVFFGIQRIFLKGISFEMPLAAKTFLEQGAPDMNMALQVSNTLLAPGIHEVTLQATLTAIKDKTTFFLLEAQQAGIFEIRDASESQLADILQVGAPSMLAPYLRAQITDTLVRASFPPFYIPEINWSAMATEARAMNPAVESLTLH